MSAHDYRPGRDNLTTGERVAHRDGHRYTWPLDLNGSRFWFRDTVARHDFAETFRALEKFGHHHVIVEDLAEVLE